MPSEPKREQAIIRAIVRAGQPLTMSELCKAMRLKSYKPNSVISRLLEEKKLGYVLKNCEVHGSVTRGYVLMNWNWDEMDVEELEKVKANLQYAIDAWHAEIDAISKRQADAWKMEAHLSNVIHQKIKDNQERAAAKAQRAAARASASNE
jgi:hypothetical protein